MQSISRKLDFSKVLQTFAEIRFLSFWKISGDRPKRNEFGPNIFFFENSALTTTVSSTVKKILSMTFRQTNVQTA